MSIFNGISFNDFRERRLALAIAEIAESNDPASIADDIIADYRLGDISVDWSALRADAVGTEVLMKVPTSGEARLFSLRVSTNNDPLPNCTIVAPTDGDAADQPTELVWRYGLNQPLNTILNAAQSARTICQQHIHFTNEGVRVFNQSLEFKIQEAVRNRLLAFAEAKKVAEAINERLNPGPNPSAV